VWKLRTKSDSLVDDKVVEIENAKPGIIFSKMAMNAKDEQIPKIKAKLGNMKRGAITEIWPKVQALWALAKDPEGSWKAKASAIGALAYLVAPIDAIPDVIPFAGLTDDVVVILFAISKIGPELKKYVVATTAEITEKSSEIEIKSHATMIKLSLIGAIGISLIAIGLKLSWIYLP
jgi:uncharacterized membrane protein YkvA (DUF1232 family)